MHDFRNLFCDLPKFRVKDMFQNLHDCSYEPIRQDICIKEPINSSYVYTRAHTQVHTYSHTLGTLKQTLKKVTSRAGWCIIYNPRSGEAKAILVRRVQDQLSIHSQTLSKEMSK